MEYLIEIVGSGLLGIIGWFVMWLKERTKLDALAPEFEDLLAKAVQYGQRKAKESFSPEDVSFKNEMVNNAVNFIFDTAPLLMKKLGINPEHVQHYVEAKMGEMLD